MKTLPLSWADRTRPDLNAIDLERDGFAIVEDAIDPAILRATIESLGSMKTQGAGTRNLLEHIWCRQLAPRLMENTAIGSALSATPVAIQCTLFDKTPDTNWLVAIHQDLSVPVKRRVSHPALGVWSEKEGQPFVQAPQELLQRLLAVRLHLDDCTKDSGALRVVPGSHSLGRLGQDEANSYRDQVGERPCEIRAGGAMLLRPLLLHASSKSAAPGHRRVLHFLFAPLSPGYGLEWPQSA